MHDLLCDHSIFIFFYLFYYLIDSFSVFSLSQNHHRVTLSPLHFLIRLTVDSARILWRRWRRRQCWWWWWWWWRPRRRDRIGKLGHFSFYEGLHTMARHKREHCGGFDKKYAPFSIYCLDKKIDFQLWLLLCLYTCKCLSKIRTLFENQCTDCNVYRLQWE